MKFAEKYISIDENAKNPDPTRIELTNEAYAMCEILDELRNQIRWKNG